MGISVIIPSKTASNLIPCVEAVRKHEPGARIIVVDDGLDLSAADARAESHCWLCDMDPALRVEGVKPFVFARNVNIGIRAAREPIDVTLMQDAVPQFAPGPFTDVVLLNDDALLQSPDGFSIMQQAAEEHPEFGVISATTNLAGNPQQRPQSVGLRAADRTIAFVCVFIPRRTLDLVGLLDERFTAYGWEDNDYCRRVRLAGLKLGIHDGCYVDHGSLTSTYRGNPRASADIRPGAEIYRQKWGSLD